LAAPVFRFRALAGLAGRRALGGDREVAVAAFVAARLASAALLPVPLPADARAARAAGARAWLAAVAVPAPARGPLARVIDASGRDDRAALAAAVRALTDVASRCLDGAARRELDGLVKELDAP
jgi:hypothetical protein